MHCRALHSRHPVRHNPALSGLSCACLACIIRTCLRSPAVHPPPLAHLPPHPPHGWGSRSHECRHPSRLLCPARAFGAAEQGADNIAVVRTKVLLDQIGVIRKPCLQSSKQPCWFSNDPSTCRVLWELQAIELSCGLAHLVQLALLIRAVRRKLLLRNLHLRLCLLNALPKHALLVCPQRHCWHTWNGAEQMPAI